MQICLIAGARPNFMKLAPLAHALRRRGTPFRIVHTGQHYDEKMSQTFFDELGIPHPDLNLEVGAGSVIWQITEIMRRLDEDLTTHRPDWLVVVGDVNSTLAAALVAAKTGIRLAHVEAGLRSRDLEMPEEVNRIIVDSCSDCLLASEQEGVDNLLNEGVSADKVHLVGNVMIDTLVSHLEAARDRKTHEQLGLAAGEYGLLTLHRPSNVDVREHLASIMHAVAEVSRDLPLVFPVHPRTRKQIEAFNIDLSTMNLKVVEPLGYYGMLGLMDAARIVLTDSGGVQEETTALRVPCLTLRENTERPSTIHVGSNQLVGWRHADILSAYAKVMSQPPRIGQVPDKWDGKAAERIVDVLTSAT
ncbi:MAG: UDP-N-acetylglucosamine 2-epimerase (non-hydrolyzing) [Planctomycetales bacterium]|nr:UDP-N-acetylglucosamine 2-epimerase (non-hydrolyzing) [Planctomycetales bacterium]